MVSLNALLQQLTLRQAFPAVAGPLSLSLVFDDQAMGGVYPVHHVVSYTTPLTVTCTDQQYVQSVNATLSSSLNSIVVTLSDAVHPQWTLYPSTAAQVNCTQFLQADSLALLSHASCHFPTPLSFAVVFGYDSQWVPSQGLKLLPSAFGKCTSYGQLGTNPYTYGVKGTVAVSVGPVAAPLMSIIGPQQVVYCESCSNDYVYLTAIPQSNIARLPSFSWSVTPPLSLPLDLQQQQLAIPLSAFNRSSGSSEVTYHFALSTQYLGISASAGQAAHDLTVTTLSQMILLPYQADNSSILSSQPLSLGVAVNFTAITPAAIKTSPVSFSWDCAVGGTSVMPDKAAGVLSANLYIPPETLTSGSVYVCTVTAQQLNTSAGTTANPSVQSFVVNVLDGDIFAVIDGGDQRLLSSDQPLTLDGSLSYDEDPLAEQRTATYLWACTAAGGADCISRIAGVALTVPVTSSWSVPANTLYPGVYVFSLFFSSAETPQRTSSTRVRVLVTGQAPEAIVSTVPASAAQVDIESVQRPAGGRIINSGDQLVLFASSTADASTLSYSWTVSGGPALASSGLVDASSAVFVVNALNDEFFFTPGYNYTFTLTLSSPLYYQSGQASMTFYINRPPVCDSFAVNPSSGVAFSGELSPFTYSFSPFDPDESRVLALMTYQVYRVDLSSQLQVDLTGEVGQTRGNLGALPTGDPSNTFQLTVGVRAWDRYRAQSLTTVTVVSTPPASGLTLQALQAYYVSVDSISRDDTMTLMIATANVMSALSSSYVDTIAAQSTPPLPNFQQFYDAYAPLKRYMVERVLDKQANVRAAVLADFLAVVMSDYSTLDQQTVVNILQALLALMEAQDEELWNDVQGDPHTLQSVVYVIQQAFHATAMANVKGLTQASVASTPPNGSLPFTFGTDYTAVGAVDEADMFQMTNTVLTSLLSHLSSLILLPGDILGLNYNRSLSGVVAKVDMTSSPVTSVAFTADPYWASQVSIIAANVPSSSVEVVDVTLLQLDGWGDRISFDIFPTFYVAINASTENPNSPFPTSYPTGSVTLTITYDQRACDDGWVNAGQFRLFVDAEQSHCNLTCASYDAALGQFTAVSGVQTLQRTDTSITCQLDGPGLYTILKDDLYAPAPNASLPSGIVTAVTTLIKVPSTLTNLSAQVVSDVSFLLDIPPLRVADVVTTAQSDGSYAVQFKLLGATMISPQDSYTLMDTLRGLGFLTTSHTFAYRLAQMSSIACLDSSGSQVHGSNCRPGDSSTTVTKVEIIAIAVVAGFFGTLCCGVVLFFCCRQMKDWWDRHDFRPASLDDDTEMSGVGATGAMSARERAEQSRLRRSNRVSWYNKDVESAAAYTYSRNSRAGSVGSDSGKKAAFRVRSDSRGSQDGELQLDDVQVVGGAGEVDLEDLAEIGLVLDGDDGGEDSYVMDGKKVKAVKQMREVDGEELSIDDSAMSRSRGSSLGSREYSQSGSRASVSANEGPMALTYPAQDEPSQSGRSDVEPTTPITPRTPGGKKAFMYTK